MPLHGTVLLLIVLFPFLDVTDFHLFDSRLFPTYLLFLLRSPLLLHIPHDFVHDLRTPILQFPQFYLFPYHSPTLR